MFEIITNVGHHDLSLRINLAKKRHVRNDVKVLLVFQVVSKIITCKDKYQSL